MGRVGEYGDISLLTGTGEYAGEEAPDWGGGENCKGEATMVNS